MKKQLVIILLLILSATNLVAQNEKDSLYAISVDSIISYKERKDLAFEQKEFKDSLNHRTVFMSFEKGSLVTIFFKGINCEETTFYIHNDSLICVRYTISDPDIRSSLPPSTTFIVYFKNDKQIYSSKLTYWGGAKTCSKFSIADKDFLNEYYYYKLKVR